jgi:hypothetical protein
VAHKKTTFEDQAMLRQEKINAYKQKKALSEKIKKIEKDLQCEEHREFWVSYVELCWIKMMDNLKMLKLEIESLAYIAEVNKNPDLKAKLEKERMGDMNKKMEFVNIPVSIPVIILLITII